MKKINKILVASFAVAMFVSSGVVHVMAEPQNDHGIVSIVKQPMVISEEGKQLAVEFLSQMDSIFTDMWLKDYYSDVTENWFSNLNTGEKKIFTDTLPEIYIVSNNGSYEGGNRIYNQQGQVLENEPWILETNYADDFMLYDFDGDGIPEIFIHFAQTFFETHYYGVYVLYRYIDGEYKPLMPISLRDGVEGGDSGFGNRDELLIDDYGRAIILFSNEMSGRMEYQHLIMTNKNLEMHTIASIDQNKALTWEQQWDAWFDHVIEKGDKQIFGTTVGLRPFPSLTEVEDKIRREITGTEIDQFALDFLNEMGTLKGLGSYNITTGQFSWSGNKMPIVFAEEEGEYNDVLNYTGRLFNKDKEEIHQDEINIWTRGIDYPIEATVYNLGNGMKPLIVVDYATTRHYHYLQSRIYMEIEGVYELVMVIDKSSSLYRDKNGDIIIVSDSDINMVEEVKRLIISTEGRPDAELIWRLTDISSEYGDWVDYVISLESNPRIYKTNEPITPLKGIKY